MVWRCDGQTIAGNEEEGEAMKRASADLPAADSVAFEPEFVARLKTLFEEQIVFNRVMGLQLSAISAERATACFDMRPELIGHQGHQRLHGGVIAATLDALGGVAVVGAISALHMDEPLAARMARFGRLGTIDLRIDYLRQAIGPHFTASAQVMRVGSRVASTRMEFFGADGRLLSTGAAAYIVS